MGFMGGTVEEERRRATRHFFSAQAELFEHRTEVRITSRVGELSLHGCYLDMMNPFPPETLVALTITAGNETFQANGRIVYSIPNVGAGAAFLDVQSKDQALLERWVGRAAEA
jgi:PilZ domain-containing protein